MTQSASPTPYLQPSTPIVLAHRGFSPDGWENTMAAFQAAVDLGCAFVETDVQATTDGVAVAFHDATLDRVTDATGRIDALEWARVSSARIGGRHHVPALEEVLATWPDLRVNIDVKSAGAVEPTAAVVNRLGAHERVCIGSFSDARRRATVAAIDGRVATSAGSAVVRAFVAAVRLGSSRLTARTLRDVDCLQVPERSGRITIVTPLAVELAASVGVPIHVWTVNRRTDMHRLLDMGVAGLVTDRADVALQVRGARS
ncbi:MAG TPA: glycerophosphodiester phosphodiesterase family protein [Nitriliruptoraceae bacterium]|nr:glycerophosphodiester phosphodiesterase family protein [Nitriliruptoraceae bacterium]